VDAVLGGFRERPATLDSPSPSDLGLAVNLLNPLEDRGGEDLPPCSPRPPSASAASGGGPRKSINPPPWVRGVAPGRRLPAAGGVDLRQPGPLAGGDDDFGDLAGGQPAIRRPDAPDTPIGPARSPAVPVAARRRSPRRRRPARGSRSPPALAVCDDLARPPVEILKHWPGDLAGAQPQRASKARNRKVAPGLAALGRNTSPTSRLGRRLDPT
jgi:hypothetical protein